MHSIQRGNGRARGMVRMAPTAMVAAVLAACGGGGSDGSSSATGGGTTPDTLAITGSAATGAAIAGKLVEARCATGSGSATTAADGSYSISISSGKLPCVARVTAADGTVLHTVATGSAASVTAHLTPATQLVVARLAGADPAAYYGSFDATAAAALTATVVGDAQAAVIATLKAGGVDFGAIGNLISSALKPKVGSAAGDAYDQLLDTLNARLASSGATLVALTGSVVAEAANLASATPASAAPGLPAAMLLQPAASNCSALRSGTYRVMAPRSGSNLSEQTGLMTLNATTLLTRDQGSSTDNPVWVPNGPCRYTTDNGTTDIAVSQAGVLVARTSNGGSNTRLLVLGFPEQAHKLAELAGSWNLIGMERNDANTAYTGVAGNVTLDANGALSALSFCKNDSTWGLKGADCAAANSGLPSLRVNSSSGGLDLVEPGSTVADSRQFVYRAGNGDLMMVGLGSDGSFNLWTRQRSNSLPTVGAATASWNFYAGAQLLSTQAVDTASNTIRTVDSAAGSFLRDQSTGGQDFTRPETLFINNPRDGFNFRVGGPVTTSINTSVTVGEFTALPLRGMGLSAVVLPTNKLFLLSVTQP
jgi:hypothetical protein